MRNIKPHNHLISVAPMMACTDRHYRVLMRCFSKFTRLYTEMVTAKALIHGNQGRLLGFSKLEKPLTLQLGGCVPEELGYCGKVASEFGYDEVNLNVGCPSNRVQAGQFGACLMKQPELVAECVAAMHDAASIPITVKTRIGVDNDDSYEKLRSFVELVAKAGCRIFIIHARKAWLKGLSPRANREVPPLRYPVVYRLKKEFPELTIVVNGGIKSWQDAKLHLGKLDGVMLGREAYRNPYMFAGVDQQWFGCEIQSIDCKEAVMHYLPYVAKQLEEGVPLRVMLRHLMGLFREQPGAREWRRYLSERGGNNRAGVLVVEKALSLVN